mgnify:CR=1 FL=1
MLSAIISGLPMPTNKILSVFLMGEKIEVILTEKDTKEKVEFLSSLIAEVIDGLM